MKKKSAPKLVTDPVCQMEFPADKAAATFKFNHRTYHFCSAACLRLFEADPLAYVDETQPDDATHLADSRQQMRRRPA